MAVCWKYATGFLDFYKGTLILGSNSVFSRGSQTTLKDESQFTGHCRVHSQDQGAVALVCFQYGGDRAWILLTGLIWAAACCPHTLGQQGQHLAPAHRSCSGGPCPPLEPMMAAVKLVDGDGLEFRKRHSGPAFGINSILYQRGLYPSETFTRVQKYGLTLLVTTDPELIKCLNNVVEQLKEWLYKCSVQKLVVVISNIESGEVLERWQFDIECDKTTKDDSAPREKSQKAIQDEICSVIRQITATVTFLPLLEVSCSFDLLIYTDKDLVVPEKGEESGPQFITSSEEVHLRSFTTTVHKVSSMVAYKIPVND
ncbi:mitotic spindle assembly checkpoint protein MAD2A-like [Lagenorhynchus albirostris]|uniref:mitotic spindle assembly checkpoint protein MAD2A-like n=1 Tax=Lagenorhynchus albirostris TaxID=27610 RepID=UPI0028E1F27D|nr:mitotic spindle assembly checkpoint protein MAD2A-like [Lagenorhynchus albirostris]